MLEGLQPPVTFHNFINLFYINLFNFIFSPGHGVICGAPFCPYLDLSRRAALKFDLRIRNFFARINQALATF